MRKHTRKLVAPIVITALVVAYYVGFFVLLSTTTGLATGWVIVGGVVPLCLAAAMIYVLIQRIKEIRSGEEDDLSQY